MLAYIRLTYEWDCDGAEQEFLHALRRNPDSAEAQRQSALLPRVKCIHTNDSKHGLSSRLDRHEHITKGKIGKAGFRRLMNDPRLAHVPKILETPKGVYGRGPALDRGNIKDTENLMQ